MSRSFDIIGSKEKAVAIVEIADEEKNRERDIAEEILRENKSVKSVLKKESARRGDYRTRRYKLMAGDGNTEVVHKEHGYSLKLDPQKVYFSSREGTERQRIAKLVNPGEVVMVMFAGIGPYAIAIGKVRPDVEKIIAVEINPDAVEYMKHNIRVNKLSHKIVPMLGDVRKVCEKWYGKCDRVVMPLPMGADSFLGAATECLRSVGIIHFYGWGEDSDPFSKASGLVDKNLKRVNTEYKIINRQIVLPYSPRKYKVRIDIMVKRQRSVKVKK